jgi:dTDP-4-dehydrorhamnose reductase
VQAPRSDRPEVWGGLECTVNRVGDAFFDQIVASGHQERPEDIERIAALGVTALRYPVLWERVAPAGLPRADWRWTDARLVRLHRCGVRPILTLLHHGSGPADTDLLDPAFPERFADYARAVAERYPDILEWTPINEPVTTARFSALYGHWYPHGRALHLFVRALLNQCRAIVLAMREIRQVNPQARLVTTDDYGRCSSTPALAYQAIYQNQRRLLALDLLLGRMNRDHALWRHLCEAGASEAELDWFAAHPCRIDVIGLNYYVTSDRFLDDRIERYPPDLVGGNGRQRYADIEAVRMAGAGLTGHRALLHELWDCYHLPLAISEVHLGCTREQQLRWLAEAWQAAGQARRQGCEVVAVTAWALLGTHDWDKLVTRCDGQYDPGAFDVRSRPPRPTALAAMVQGLARHGRYHHPVLAGAGWWRTAGRVLNDPAPGDVTSPAGPPLLITGAGTLGRAIERLATARGLPCLLLARESLDITVERSVKTALDRHQPWAVINAAGYVRVDEAEAEADRCWRENVLGPVTIAAACRQRRIELVTFSSDLVFAGTRTEPYVESDAPQPLGVYGRTKAEAEARVHDLLDRALIVRTAAFFGLWDEANFITRALRLLAEGRRVLAAADLVVSPTFVPDLVEATLDLLIDGASGVWHLCNQGALSWADLARQAAQLDGLDPELVEGRPWSSLGLVAPRPAFSALASERGRQLRPLPAALEAFTRDYRRHSTAGSTGQPPARSRL